MATKYVIGADIGGSHISTLLVDLQTERIVAQSHAQQKVDNQASADEILNNWATAIRKTMEYAKDGDLAGIGFAMPGPFDYKTGVALLKNVAKYDSLYGINVGNELKKRLDLPLSMPFRYLNDAMAFAIGECWQGKASEHKNVVAITLGTGFGSAFLTSGVPVIEGDRVPSMGYVYHIPYKNGIADDYFSTRWFVSQYAQRTGLTCKGVKEIAERTATDIKAKNLFEDFGRDLGQFMTPLLKTFEAGCLVIGGNISGAYPLFGPSFEKALSDQKVTVEIVLSELMESAAMVGCARLLNEKFWKEVEPLVSKI
jgi:glucokinase